MKKKLIKEVNFYGLKVDDKIVGLSDHTTNNLLNYPHKLSLKNCEAIANGYNLDKLISVELKKLPYEKHVDDGQYNDGQLAGFELGAEWGFQKALEILGDKKFSEVNMEDAYYFGSRKLRGEYLDFVKTFQQTEWDVEIVTEPMNLDEIREQGKGFLNSPTNKPKLDAKGCLLLKKI